MPETKTEKLWTVEDLAHVPDNDRNHEIVYGELVEEGPMGTIPNLVAQSIFLALHENRAGGKAFQELDYLLQRDPDLVRRPDVSYVGPGRMPARPPAGPLPLAPDLAVEVMSQSDSSSEVLEKARQYLRHGVKLVWVADPFARTLSIHRSGRPRTVLSRDDEAATGEDVLPGLRLSLATVFAGIPADIEPEPGASRVSDRPAPSATRPAAGASRRRKR